MIHGTKELRKVGDALYTFVENNPKYILYALITFMTLFYTLALHVSYLSFTGYDSFDKALMYQIFWNTFHGNFFYSSINESCYFAGHCAWIFLLFLPFYEIYPHPITLSVISSLLISLGALPVYWLAREKLGKDIYGIFFAIIYLMYPPLSWMYLESIKAEIFAVPLLLFTFYYFQKEDFKKFLIFMLLSLMCKENISLVIFMFGIYALLNKKDKKWIIMPVMAGLLCFILEFKLLMPYFLPPSGNPFPVGDLIGVRYGHLGHNFTEIIKTILLHPLFTFEYAFKWEKIHYIYQLLLPLAFLPLLKPKILLIALPIFAQNLLSNCPYQYSIYFHYNAVLVAILIIATIYAVRDIVRFLSDREYIINKKSVLSVILMVILICTSYSAISFGAQGKALNAIVTYQESDKIQSINELIKIIPENASLSTNTYLAPQLSARKELGFFSLHNPENYDYVLINPAHPTGIEPESYFKRVVHLMENKNYKIIAFTDSLVLFKKDKEIKENELIRATIWEKFYFRAINYLATEEQKFLIDAFLFQQGSVVYPKNDIFHTDIEDSTKIIMASNNWHGLEHWRNISTRWTSNNATIFIYSPENRDSNLSLKVISFYKPRTLQIYLNDELIYKQAIPRNIVEIEIQVKLKEGDNILKFYAPDGCQRPCDIPELKNKDSRCLGLAFQNITLTALKKIYDVDFIDYSIPDSMVVNSFYSYNITIENTGAEKWDRNSENPVYVSYHWLKDNEVVLWDGIRTKLPCDMLPGDTIKMDMNIGAPDEEGNYILIIDLVKEGITWFETQGTVPIKKNVTVTRDQLKQISGLKYQTECRDVNELKKLIDHTLDSSAMSFGGTCGRVYGFYAGSGYPQIWVRDSATIIPIARYFYSDEFLRIWIEEFLINQAEDGSIKDYISPMGCDKNTVETDQETSLVHSAYQYYKISGNKSWLLTEINGKTIIDRLTDSLRYILKYRYNSTYGLVTGAFTADWGDVQFEYSPGTDITNRTHWTCDIYDNSMFYRACEELSILYSELECKENATFWSRVALSIKENTNNYLWQSNKGFYKVHVYLTPVNLDFTESDMFPMGGNAIAVKAGLANSTQASQIFEVAKERKNEANATTIGCVLYPPYPEGFFANPIMDEEHEYQNGGQWDWFAGRLILAEFENGFSEDAIKHLQEISKQAVSADGFYEWYTLNGTGKGSSDYAGSAGALGQCIIEGYFGVYLSHDNLEIKPRLGNRDGSIYLYEPATDVWIAYNYTLSQNNVIILTYESNFPKSGKIGVLVPDEKRVSEILIDNASVPYNIDTIGNDTYVSFITDFKKHECEIIFVPKSL
jgi:uncharacterized membrane protein